MTTGSMAETAVVRGGVGWDSLGDNRLPLARFVRPLDVWLSEAFVALHSLWLIWSVE